MYVNEHAVNPVEVVDVVDPTQPNIGFQFEDVDVVQLPSNGTTLLGRRILVRLPDCLVIYSATNLRLRTRRDPQLELMAYITLAPAASGSVDGVPMTSERIAIIPPRTKVGFVTGENYESIGFLLQPKEIAECLRLRQEPSDGLIPTKVETLRVGSDEARSLFEWGKQLIDIAIERPELFQHGSEYAKAARQDLVERLLDTLVATHVHTPDRSERTLQMRSKLVRTVEALVMANSTAPLCVTDLCKLTAVSERRLEYAFKTVMGISPSSYLTRLRMHQVRKALLDGHPGKTSVTQEAVNWGFWHFGEFSGAYRKCFGELPSETLRRIKKMPASD